MADINANEYVGNLTELSSHIPLNEINPDTLINQYLTGLEHLFVDINGNPWPDSWWWWKLSKGLERIEEGSHVTVTPRKHVELRDYSFNEFKQFAYFKLYKSPVFSVKKVQAVYPITGGTPTGSSHPDDRGIVVDYPVEWVRLYPNGDLHLVPTYGSLSKILIGQGGALVPPINSFLDYFPQHWRIEYIAGFQTEKIPFIIADAIFKAAAVEALTVLSDTVKPVGALSMETRFRGLIRKYSFERGDTTTASVFTSRIRAYKADLYGDKGQSELQTGGLISAIRNRYCGINMSVA